MLRKILNVLALALGVVGFGAPAKADNIHLCDINQYTSCNSGNAIQVHGSLPQQAWVFGTAAGNETLYFAVLTPQGGGSGTFSGTGGTSTNLWTALGFGSPAPQNFPNFSSTLSQEQLATGLTPGSFNATSFQVGTWTGSVNIGQSVNLPPGPIGTIYIAYLVDSSGNLIAVSPWSSSLIFVPEPPSLVLLGVGLLGIGALVGRRILSS